MDIHIVINKMQLIGQSLERLYISSHKDKVSVKFTYRKKWKNPIVLEFLFL